jgi:hypothetical protein
MIVNSTSIVSLVDLAFSGLFSCMGSLRVLKHSVFPLYWEFGYSGSDIPAISVRFAINV